MLRESHRLGIEPATCRSQVQRPTAEPAVSVRLSVRHKPVEYCTKMAKCSITQATPRNNKSLDLYFYYLATLRNGATCKMGT